MTRNRVKTVRTTSTSFQESNVADMWVMALPAFLVFLLFQLDDANDDCCGENKN